MTTHRHVDSFNHNLKILTRDLASRYPNDPVVWRAERRVMTIINIDPIYVIDTVGAYLFPYRDQIYNLTSATGDAAEAFFLENTYDSELKASVSEDNASLVSYVLPKAKECARTLPPAEKHQYKEFVITLLDCYIEYLAAKNGL